MISFRFLLPIAVCVLLGACNTTVQVPNHAVGNVGGGPGPYGHMDAVVDLQDQRSYQADMVVEAKVSEGCVSAWRKALKGDKKAAFAELDELSRSYPNVATINFMRGQIYDHCGNPKEAIAFYQKAITDKEFSAMYVYKFAEALRKDHREKEAISQYQRLEALAPEFVPAKIGMAQALLADDKKSGAARDELKAALVLEPDNKDAKAVLDSMNGK